MSGVHRFPVRVYYEDTDFSGLVYHANYLKFCERARSDYLRSVGIDQNVMAGSAYFVVRRMVCDFLRPAKFDDELAVETSLLGMSGARFELEQKVLRAADTLFTAIVTVALIDEKGRPVRIPATVQEKLTLSAPHGPK